MGVHTTCCIACPPLSPSKAPGVNPEARTLQSTPVSSMPFSGCDTKHINFKLAYIAGASSQLFNITSCVGDTFALNCTVVAVSHIWKIGSGGEVSVTSGLVKDLHVMGFTYRPVSEPGSTALVSSIIGTVTAELNNTLIVCRDGTAALGVGDMQQATATILG